jgi:hypothetical protein
LGCTNIQISKEIFLNQPASALGVNPSEPSETKKLIRSVLRKAPKYWKSITAVISLYASGTAILGLYIYLSTIGRVDLFMPSIAISPALFAWLFCATLVLFAALLCIVTPAIVFAGLVSLFSLPTKHAARLGTKFAALTAGGFAVLTFTAFNTSEESFPWSILGVWILGLTGIMGIVGLTKRQRGKYLNKVRTNNPYPGKEISFVLFASIIYLCTVLTGIYPALFISMSHSESASNYGPYLIGAISIFWMLILFIPIITFYKTDGVLTKKISNSFVAASVAILSFFAMSPSLFGLVAYSAASAVKLRDQQVSEYIVSKKYPKATLDPNLWQLREIKDEDKSVTIQAFPLFKFGDTLLLCPARYAHLTRDDIAAVTKYCFATTKSEMTQAAPTSSPPIYLRETYCGREFTQAPLVLSKKQQCVFAPQKSNPLAI